jgi:hypothetical protein
MFVVALLIELQMYVPLWLRKWPIIFVRKKNLAIKPGSELL